MYNINCIPSEVMWSLPHRAIYNMVMIITGHINDGHIDLQICLHWCPGYPQYPFLKIIIYFTIFI